MYLEWPDTRIITDEVRRCAQCGESKPANRMYRDLGQEGSFYCGPCVFRKTNDTEDCLQTENTGNGDPMHLAKQNINNLNEPLQPLFKFRSTVAVRARRMRES